MTSPTSGCAVETLDLEPSLDGMLDLAFTDVSAIPASNGGAVLENIAITGDCFPN